jgi:hypothetical protein
MHLAAENIPVAEKRGEVNASIALKISLYRDPYISLAFLCSPLYAQIVFYTALKMF